MKKKKSKKPKALPVQIRREEVSTKFRSALASNKPAQLGRPPHKYNEVIAAVGSELPFFIDACCDIRVTTRQLMETIRSMGVVISYATMTAIRKQVEQDNRWFYDLLEQAVSNEDEETVKVL
jgi:hypothetical protein